jgi:hypothetical protein
MDYGYQLLRHVLQQVFGNLREAAQLTLLLFLAPFVGFVLLGFGAMLATGGMPEPGGRCVRCAGRSDPAGRGIVCLLLGRRGWHRYVLMEEPATGSCRHGAASMSAPISGAPSLVGVVMMLAVIGGGLVDGAGGGADAIGGAGVADRDRPCLRRVLGRDADRPRPAGCSDW